MRKLVIIFFILTLSIFNGCIKYNINKFASDEALELNIPPLIMEFDTTAYLENQHYKAIKYYKLGVNYTFENRYINDYSIILQQFKADGNNLKKGSIKYTISDLAKDINLLLKNELTPTKSSEGKGNLKLKWYVEDIRTNSNFRLWFGTSALTLFTINFLGYPASDYSVNLNLIVKICDYDDVAISSYKANGYGKLYSAMFWGYSLANDGVIPHDISKNSVYKIPSLVKATNLEAISNALENIKSQIQKDIPHLLDKFK